MPFLIVETPPDHSFSVEAPTGEGNAPHPITSRSTLPPFSPGQKLVEIPPSCKIGKGVARNAPPRSPCRMGVHAAIPGYPPPFRTERDNPGTRIETMTHSDIDRTHIIFRIFVQAHDPHDHGGLHRKLPRERVAWSETAAVL